MRLKFSIHYRTEWGQQLVVDLSCTAADGTRRQLQVPMLTQDGDFWWAETTMVESRRSQLISFSYIYKVVDADGKELRREWRMPERSYSFDTSKSYTMSDQWADRPLAFHLYSSAYVVTTGQTAQRSEESRLPMFRRTVLFRVSAPQLLPGQQLAVVGSHPSMGMWSPARYLAMEYAGQHDWMLTLDAGVLLGAVEYKFVVVDETSHQLIAWEEGDNRVLADMPADGEVMVICGEPLRLAERTWRAAGVSIPVFSLRSEHSFGVGDFGDLYRFVDWAAAVGMKFIQLLPVHDTTYTRQWGDSYPYNIVSAFALHPHYLDLEQMGSLKSKQRMTVYRRRQRELNALPYSDYEAVDRVKSEYISELVAELEPEAFESKEFTDWVADNADWLEAYVQWLLNSAAPVKGLNGQTVRFVQFHLHRQLKQAAEHARQLGVVLKGDLPIGVSRHSAETAQHPDFFHLDGQTGAPPDAFAAQGQNWGFPTYNWEAPVIPWLKRRLHQMEQYFDALRIDHVLGFFRIWEIPESQLFGTMGHFSPALPFTPGEIEYFGLPFRRDFLTQPFINDRIVERLFGIHAQYVRDTFLNRKAYGLYELKEEVSTQRKVQRLFEGRGDENSLWIRDGLYRLVANVLFLEDQRQPDTYHPRIAAYQEPVFEVLSAEERDAYMRLYNNFFYQRHSMFWGQTAYNRLFEVLSDTRMLVCAEDLGMLPDCVGPVLDALRILTLEIQQLPKLSGQEFAHLDGNPVRSVATISTHDMAPLRLWWTENQDRAQRYYTTMLQKQGIVPEQLPAHVAEEVIARHLYSPSMLCILQLQDWLAMDSELRSPNPKQERINVPSDPYNRWQWRMHLTIEQLVAADRFNEKLKTIITRSKRGR